MKMNHHIVVPSSHFTLESGADALTEYRFNTMVAVHRFCKHCGVQAYYNPRSNPDGVGVTFACLDEDSSKLCDPTFKNFDGSNWEEYYAGAGKEIIKCSAL